MHQCTECRLATPIPVCLHLLHMRHLSAYAPLRPIGTPGSARTRHAADSKACWPVGPIGSISGCRLESRIGLAVPDGGTEAELA